MIEQRPAFFVPVLARAAAAIALTIVMWAAIALPASAQVEGGPPAYDYVSCGHFETQEDAQAALDSGELDGIGMESLDPDGDGIACEIRWGESTAGEVDSPATNVTALPSTGSGTPAMANVNGVHVAVTVTLLLLGAAAVSLRMQRIG